MDQGQGSTDGDGAADEGSEPAGDAVTACSTGRASSCAARLGTGGSGSGSRPAAGSSSRSLHGLQRASSARPGTGSSVSSNSKSAAARPASAGPKSSRQQSCLSRSSSTASQLLGGAGAAGAAAAYDAEAGYDVLTREEQELMQQVMAQHSRRGRPGAAGYVHEPGSGVFSPPVQEALGHVAALQAEHQQVRGRFALL